MIKELYTNTWCSIKSIENKELGIEPFYFKHLEKLKYGIVAILPYRYKNYPSLLYKEYLLVEELRPSWCIRDIEENRISLVLASITGGIDKNERPEVAVLRELKEETGYEVPPEISVEFLGFSGTDKDSDTNVYLFSVDLTEIKPGEIKKDGSALEKYTTPKWISDISNIYDPLVAQMYVKLNRNNF